MAVFDVAQVLVFHDDHISIADFFEGAKAQVVDTELSYGQTVATTTKKEMVEEKKKSKDFLNSLE